MYLGQIFKWYLCNTIFLLSIEIFFEVFPNLKRFIKKSNKLLILFISFLIISYNNSTYMLVMYNNKFTYKYLQKKKTYS